MDIYDLISHYGLIALFTLILLYPIPRLLERFIGEGEKPKRKRKNDEILLVDFDDSTQEDIDMDNNRPIWIAKGGKLP